MNLSIELLTVWLILSLSFWVSDLVTKLAISRTQTKLALPVISGDRSVPNSLVAQAYYHANQLEINNDVHIRISMRNHLPDRVEGYTIYQDDRSVGGVIQALIVLRRNSSFPQQSRTLAHEMVHVNQFFTGKLVKCGTKNFRWKGGECKHIGRDSYHSRAWEKEARSKGHDLYENFRKHGSDILSAQ